MRPQSPERTCQYCGARWVNHGSRFEHRTRYCSDDCARKGRQARNVGARGIVPVGRTFTRADDGAIVMVFEDARGLPFVEALREMAYAGMEVVGG